MVPTMFHKESGGETGGQRQPVGKNPPTNTEGGSGVPKGGYATSVELKKLVQSRGCSKFNMPREMFKGYWGPLKPGKRSTQIPLVLFETGEVARPGNGEQGLSKGAQTLEKARHRWTRGVVKQGGPNRVKGGLKCPINAPRIQKEKWEV